MRTRPREDDGLVAQPGSSKPNHSPFDSSDQIIQKLDDGFTATWEKSPTQPKTPAATSVFSFSPSAKTTSSLGNISAIAARNRSPQRAVFSGKPRTPPDSSSLPETCFIAVPQRTCFKRYKSLSVEKQPHVGGKERNFASSETLAVNSGVTSGCRALLKLGRASTSIGKASTSIGKASTSIANKLHPSPRSGRKIKNFNLMSSGSNPGENVLWC